MQPGQTKHKITTPILRKGHGPQATTRNFTQEMMITAA